ncbi:MAG: hypothetical protein NW202_13040 [Nitrospira sp.]|nr:hypothetical protein [Nitrospira sp.]
MLDFLKAAPELIPVEDDPDVRVAQKALADALAELSQLEARERRFIDIVTGKASHITQSEDDAAREQLVVKKGTQDLWLLPEAEGARRLVAALRVTKTEAVQRARANLEAAALLKLKDLCGRLRPALVAAMAVAEEIENLRQEVGQGGGDIDVHPFPVLLPGSLLAGQLEIARGKGLL